MSGMTMMPRSRRMSSASGVVGPLAASATMRARTCRALRSVITPSRAAGRFLAALAPADADWLASDHTGDRVAVVHRVRVHHPGHHLRVGVHVWRRDVAFGTDHVADLRREAPRQALQLAAAHRLRIAG